VSRPEITRGLFSATETTELVGGRGVGSGWSADTGFQQRVVPPLQRIPPSDATSWHAAALAWLGEASSDGSLAFVLPVPAAARNWAEQVWLRTDAGFLEPELLETLEEEGSLYVARLKMRLAVPLLALAPQFGVRLRRAGVDRGREVETAYHEPDSFAANEARLLVELITANLLHAGAEPAGAR